MPYGPKIPWSDDKTEQLKKLWQARLSAGQIAVELGNVTRNAVIGKVHRLNLTKRERKGRPAGPQKPRVRSSTPKFELTAKRSNLSGLTVQHKERTPQRLVKFLGRPVQDYPFGDKHSPFPSAEYGSDGFTLADIKAIQSLYV